MQQEMRKEMRKKMRKEMQSEMQTEEQKEIEKPLHGPHDPHRSVQWLAARWEHLRSLEELHEAMEEAFDASG